MRYFIYTLLLIILTSSTKNPTLRVEITGIKNTDGLIEIGLYNKASTFPSTTEQFRVQRVKVTAPKTTVVFSDIPIGVYGISVYHDKNKDKKCNLNWIGYPTEGFCFSNNFKPFLSAPKFKDVQFIVKKNKTIQIKMLNQ